MIRYEIYLKVVKEKLSKSYMKYIKLFNESKISSDDYDSIKQYIEDIS